MIAIILMLLLSSGPSLIANAGQARLTYKGAWFEIKYPSNFKVRPSLRSSSGRGYDSVFFSSPDGTVEFYVFSPQWNGEPADIEMNPQSEVQVSQNTEKRAGRIVRRMTIRARDNSYLRSFEDTEDTTTNTRKVFGIKYRNEAAYSRYRQSYLTFKQSLTQFAD
ncbi:MAG: hypothetical protein ACXW3C_06535 [Pyrinomonadaceae bacterium]